jgi:hypothetical protein
VCQLVLLITNKAGKQSRSACLGLYRQEWHCQKDMVCWTFEQQVFDIFNTTHTYTACKKRRRTVCGTQPTLPLISRHACCCLLNAVAPNPGAGANQAAAEY